MGMPLSDRDARETLKGIVEDLGIVLIIVDSVGMAAGGDLNDQITAANYYTSLKGLCPRSISISHQPKNVDEHMATPFGSTYWFAQARLVWQSRIASKRHANSIALVCRKSSDTEDLGELFFEINWTTERISLTSAEAVTIADRSAVLLTDNPHGLSAMTIRLRLGIEARPGRLPNAAVTEALGRDPRFEHDNLIPPIWSLTDKALERIREEEEE
jgi:hypothetical protein